MHLHVRVHSERAPVETEMQTFQSKLIGIISKTLRTVVYFRDQLQIFLNSAKGKKLLEFFFYLISLLSPKVKNKRTHQTIAAPCMFLCTRAFLYASYSLLLIPNKFWMGGEGGGNEGAKLERENKKGGGGEYCKRVGAG